MGRWRRCEQGPQDVHCRCSQRGVGVQVERGCVAELCGTLRSVGCSLPAAHRLGRPSQTHAGQPLPPVLSTFLARRGRQLVRRPRLRGRSRQPRRGPSKGQPTTQQTAARSRAAAHCLAVRSAKGRRTESEPELLAGPRTLRCPLISVELCWLLTLRVGSPVCFRRYGRPSCPPALAQHRSPLRPHLPCAA